MTQSPTTTSAHLANAVLTAIAIGARTPSRIAAAAGHPAAAVQPILDHLQRAGRVSRSLLGTYALTDAGRVRLLITATARPEPAPDDLPGRWHHRVAQHVLHGSRIVAVDRAYGMEIGQLWLDGARHTIDDVLRHRPRIAAALDRRPEQIVVEDDGSGFGHRLRLLVVDDTTPLYQALEHPGRGAYYPELGELTIGLHADRTPALWPLWTSAGTRPSIVTGGPGSGTSGTLRGVLAGLAGHDTVTVHAIDPLGSAGLAGDGWDTATSETDAGELLFSLWELARRRSTDAARAGTTILTPSRQCPLQVLVIGGLPQVLRGNRRGARLLADIQRLSRRTGIAITAETDCLTLDGFGNDAALQGALLCGNLTILRGLSGTSLNALPHRVSQDLRALPATWHNGANTTGVGYTIGRNAPLRTFHVPAAHAQALTPAG
jgi:hypothetical protein